MSMRSKELDLAQRKIFIGGLSYSTDDDKLKSYFSSYGAVHDAVVMKDPVSCRSRGFGFITFEDVDSVDSVLENEPHIIDSRKVEAKRAVPKTDSADGYAGNNSNNAVVNTATSSNSKGSNISASGKSSLRPGVSKSSGKGVGTTHFQADSTSGANGNSENSQGDNGHNQPNTSSSSSTGSTSGSSNINVNNSRSAEDANGYLKIFVGGLHYDTRDADFRAYFEKYGKVQYAEVMFNRETHKSRGFGFIIFESEDSVDSVCDEREHVIDAKVVEVKRAIPRSKFPSQGNNNSNSPSSTNNKVIGTKNAGPLRATVGGAKSSRPQGSLGAQIKAAPASTTTPLSNPASSWAALVKRSDPIPESYINPENNVHLDDTVITHVNQNNSPSDHIASAVNNATSMSPIVETRSVRSASEGGGNIFVGDIHHSNGYNFAHQSGYSSEPNLSSGILHQPQSVRSAPVELSPQQQQMMAARSPQQYISTIPNLSGSGPSIGYPPTMNLPPTQQQQQMQVDNSIFGAAAGDNLNPAAAAFNFMPGVSYLSGQQQQQTNSSFPSKSDDVATLWNSGSGVGLEYPSQPSHPTYHQQMMWNSAKKGSSNGGNNDGSSMNSVRNNDSGGTELDDVLMMQNLNSLNMLDHGENRNRNNFF